jgi:hypothetical protein
MKKLLAKLKKEKLVISIGAHGSVHSVGWYATVYPYGTPCPHTWAEAGHGLTYKEACKQAYRVFKGKAEATPSEYFRK